MKNIKTGLLSRGPQLFKAGINLAFQSNIDKTVESLSQMKGLPQKFGQLLSMDFSEYFPEDIRHKFEILQGEGKSIDFYELHAVIKSHLPIERIQKIHAIDTTPLGAGSIGQVHRARIDDLGEVVFKIKYPNIEKTINSDLSLLLPVVAAFKLIRPQVNDLEIVIKETKKLLAHEMDYVRERNYFHYFKAALEQHPHFVVPKVYADYSSHEFFCMEYIEGIPLKNFIRDPAVPLERKQKVTTHMLELFIKEFLELRTVQTDPNFANYLITDDDRIVLLDFGATLEFSSSFIDEYTLLLIAAYEHDRKNILKYGEKFGLIYEKDNLEAQNIFEDFLKDVFDQFKPENNPVNFKNSGLTSRLMEKGWNLWKKQRISNPHSDLLFLHRKIGGLFSLLRESGVNINLSLLWPQILKHRESPGKVISPGDSH